MEQPEPVRIDVLLAFPVGDPLPGYATADFITVRTAPGARLASEQEPMRLAWT
jgi:hypothetical protein